MLMRRFIIFSIIFLCTIFFTIAAIEYTFDRNNDEIPDQWIEYENGVALSEKRDRNFDGIIDYIAKFDKSSRRVYEEMDFNYDGEMDDFYYYENGLLVLRKIDSNYDGEIDIIIHILDGIYIAKYEMDTDFDGTFDKVREYKK